GRAPIREGVKLFDADDNEVGLVTSGGFGPSIAQPIMIAFINKDFSVLGTEVFAEVRKKRLPVQVTSLPFVKNNYFRG
ncbi:MAG: glycine cleavage system aminomethyltransferase GcvT, partial [Pseudomonadales bacterium]|nr:glycine cleavage system aminomethyltransferase GcvT [Pseudomonadales bacterium]